MKDIDIELETPIALLTVGQLIKIMNAASTNQLKKQPIIEEKKFVYGLDGIKKLFNVSHATAQRYKHTIIKDAVSQNGRKLVIDAEKAMELFKASKKGK